MKKYLMSGVAAIAFLAAFTSCSKTTDLYEEGRKEKDQAEQKAKTTLETFNEAFVETFGTPDPNHHWGFDKPAESRAFTASTRAPQAPTVADWDFADGPTDADFDYTKSAIPDDALLPSEYGDATKGSVHNYKLVETTDVQNVAFYAGNYNLYISGTKSINYTNPGDGSKNMRIYVMPGANVTFTEAFTQKASGELTMYIPATATVNFKNGLQAYITLYNRGTINVQGNSYKPGIYDGGIFYNEGTFNVTGSQDYYFGNKNNNNVLTLNNGDSQFINAGTLNIGALTLEGSSHFLNLGTANVTGSTIVNSNQCTWVNEDQYTTGEFIYNAGSTDVRNNCKMTVTNMFTINLGDTDKNNFTNNAGASVVTNNFEFTGPGYIKMGAKSLFKVENTATMNITKPDYGFWGPTSGSDYAVLQAKNIVSGSTYNSKYVTYGGNIYVYAEESHFKQQWSGQYPFYYLEGNAKIYAEGDEFEDGKPTITILPSKCNPGFEGDEEIYDGRIMAEDLNATESSDFDYNDVVFDYKIDVAARKAKIKLRAAGGIYPLTVGGVEVHAKFGFSDSYPMINTGDGVTATAEAYEYDFPTGVDPSAENIPVIVTKEGIPYTLGAPTGEAAAKFCVVTTCKWMKERKFISDAYDKFDDWVRDSSVKWTTSIKDPSLLYNE